jgi:hypothetical protein
VISDTAYEEIQNQIATISKDRNWGFDLSEKEFIKGMSLLNPQSYGGRIESYIRRILGYSKILAKENSGDIRSLNNKDVEVKVSLLTITNPSLNMVQLRLFQDLDYYLCVAYDLRKISEFNSYIFLLTHDEMKKECEIYNVGAAHGTKKTNLQNENIELRMSFNCDDGDEQFSRWKQKYLFKSFYDVRTCIHQK